MEQRVHEDGVSSPAQVIRSIQPPGLSISDAINATTQREHVHLNRLIIQRLPLALPPTATDPSIYGRGIAAFARIYLAFEQVWAEVVASVDLLERSDQSHEAQLRRCLGSLRPAGLERSNRLTNDLSHIRKRTSTDVEKCSRAQERMLRRMRKNLLRRPHTLLAYGWVLYMALFSGGRIIRKQLLQAGSEFWLATNGDNASDVSAFEKGIDLSVECLGFSFLCFDDGTDGTSIKADFKSRLADAEKLLSQKERQDIIAAARTLFEDCIALVGILDGEVRTQIAWSIFLLVAQSIFALALLLFWLWIGLGYWNG